jgi:hypothetical protein
MLGKATPRRRWKWLYLTPWAKVRRLSLKTPMAIRASLMASSLLPFSSEPSTSDGTYWVTSIWLKRAMSSFAQNVDV